MDRNIVCRGDGQELDLYILESSLQLCSRHLPAAAFEPRELFSDFSERVLARPHALEYHLCVGGQRDRGAMSEGGVESYTIDIRVCIDRSAMFRTS